MIETKVPMDVRSYKTKVIGPLTLRQLICIVLAVIVDVVVYLMILRPLNVSLRPTIFTLVFVDVPIMAFTMDIMGMPTEQYIKSVLIRSIIAPTKRKAKSSLPKRQRTVYSSAEIKKSKKKMKNLLKSHPEFKAYK